MLRFLLDEHLSPTIAEAVHALQLVRDMGEQDHVEQDVGDEPSSHQGVGRLIQNTMGRRKPHLDKMDRIVQAARDAGVLEGETRRIILGGYELHKGLKWDGRVSSAGGTGIVILLIAYFLHAPQPVIWVLFGLWVLVVVLLLGIEAVHVVRGLRIRYGEDPSDDTPAPAEDSPLDRYPIWSSNPHDGAAAPGQDNRGVR